MKTVTKTNDMNGVSEVILTYETRVNPKSWTKVTTSRAAYKLLF